MLFLFKISGKKSFFHQKLHFYENWSIDRHDRYYIKTYVGSNLRPSLKMTKNNLKFHVFVMRK